MSSGIIRQIVVVVATIATVVVNYLANALPINGVRTQDVSDQFVSLFTPAGYVFAIWGLIYLGLIAYTVYQALPSQRDNPRLQRVGFLYVLSAAANIVWLLLWHFRQIPLSVVLMLVLLGSLIAIYQTLGTGRTSVSTGEHWAVRVPFSIYLGWISVATVANISSALVSVNWNGLGISPAVWTIIVLVVATALAALASWLRRDIAYQLVIIWAFVGIGQKVVVPEVQIAAYILAAVVAVIGITGYIAKRNQRFPEAR